MQDALQGQQAWSPCCAGSTMHGGKQSSHLCLVNTGWSSVNSNTTPAHPASNAVAGAPTRQEATATCSRPHPHNTLAPKALSPAHALKNPPMARGTRASGRKPQEAACKVAGPSQMQRGLHSLCEAERLNCNPTPLTRLCCSAAAAAATPPTCRSCDPFKRYAARMAAQDAGCALHACGCLTNTATHTTSSSRGPHPVKGGAPWPTPCALAMRGPQ